MPQIGIIGLNFVCVFLCLTMTARAAKYVVFHRHGQRAPTRNIASPIVGAAAAAGGGAQDDEDTWLGQLPSVAVLDRLNSHFKIAQHPDNPLQVQEQDTLSAVHHQHHLY